MAVQTGRTVSKWVSFNLGDAGNGALRTIPVDSISALGITYDETDLTAWMDAVKGSLPNMPDAPIDITGPFDTTAATTVGSLSGSHAVLAAILAAQVTTITPLTVDVRIGIRHTWETGEPNFGLTATATSGYYLSKYDVDLGAGKYSASFRLVAGSSLPAFGTSDETT
jgi:hypothetical protein